MNDGYLKEINNSDGEIFSPSKNTYGFIKSTPLYGAIKAF